MGKGDGKQYQEGGAKYGGKTESFSRCGEKNILEYPGKVDGERKGYGKNELKQNIDLYFLFGLFDGFPNEEGADCLKDQPVGKDDPEGEFVTKKRDEELPQAG